MKNTYTIAAMTAALRKAAVAMPLERRYEAMALREAVEILFTGHAALVEKNGGDKTFSASAAMEIMRDATSQGRAQIIKNLQNLHIANLVEEAA